jgi:hypothetical protein
MDYLHLFNLSGLIAKFLLSQGCIPCNLCHFNIREFALKEGVSKNLIIFNPFFKTLLILLPHPLFPFFCPSPSFLLYALPILLPSPFLPFFALLIFSLFLACLSYYPSLSFPLSTPLVLLAHTHFPYLPLLCLVVTHTPCPSFWPTYLVTHTLSLSPSPSFYPFHFFHVATHTPIFFLSQTQKGQKEKKITYLKCIKNLLLEK